MKTRKALIFFFTFIIAANISYAFQANSSNYKLSTGVISSGGEIVNSSSYKSYVAAGIIAGITNSSTYKNLLGFFYTWLLADEQPCTSASQCEGGYCCSDLCKSSSCPVAAGTGGGGGAAAAAGGGGGMLPEKEELKDYSISPSNIKTKLMLGESAEEKLKISNTGNTALTISLAIEGVEEYLFLSNDAIDLEAEMDEEVILNFIGKRVGSFVGQVIAKADGIEKSVPVILEVISELVLFDAKLDIPAAYAEVEAGNELKAQITLLNVGAPEKVDVFVTYFIKDLKGNAVYEETETFAVEKQASYPKSFIIHENTVPGSYVAVVEVIYADSFAVSSQLFRVVEKKEFVETEILTKNKTLTAFLVFMMVGVVFMLIYKLAPVMKKGRRKKKGKKRK